jgi:hypothetical protein
MNIKFFVVFHKIVYPELYKIKENDNKYITFYGVNDKINIDNVIYEQELEIYNKNLQERKYNEGSCLYHIYMNKLYEEYDYIGFCQYDMIFEKDIFINIETQINTNHNTIFFIDFFDWTFLGGPLVQDYDDYIGGLKSYNQYFNTSFTEHDLFNNKMPICNTFLVPKHIYVKMMSWLNQYYIDKIQISMYDKINNFEFNPGHMIEGLTGMFLALETCNGAVYHRLDMTHSQSSYKVI